MTNFNCACPAIQRGQGSGLLSEGSSWLTAYMSEQWRFWRDCADAQARLNLRCSHRRYVPNSLDAAQLIMTLKSDGNQIIKTVAKLKWIVFNFFTVAKQSDKLAKWCEFHPNKQPEFKKFPWDEWQPGDESRAPDNRDDLHSQLATLGHEREELEPWLIREMDQHLTDVWLTGNADLFPQILYLIAEENVTGRLQMNRSSTKPTKCLLRLAKTHSATLIRVFAVHFMNTVYGCVLAKLF